MKVRFLKSIAAARWSYSAGEEAELDSTIAAPFIASGICEPILDDVETAAVEQKVETAMRPKARGRRR